MVMIMINWRGMILEDFDDNDNDDNDMTMTMIMMMITWRH